MPLTPMTDSQLGAMSVLSIAHVGDAVYELLVRSYLTTTQGAMKVSAQHKATISYVAAPAQAEAMQILMPHLSDEEQSLYRRGRNARVNSTPQGCTIAEYHAATGLEMLFGSLWLTGRAVRCEELFALITEARHGA